jgi:membrane protease YdiL (CAAX protease family)
VAGRADERNSTQGIRHVVVRATPPEKGTMMPPDGAPSTPGASPRPLQVHTSWSPGTTRPGDGRLDRPGEGSGTAVRSFRSWTRFLLGFAVLYAVLSGVSSVDATARSGLVVLAAVVVAAVVVERVLYPAPLGTVLRRLGFGRPTARPLLASAAVSCLLLLVYPVYGLIDAPLALRSDWVWILMGVFALHGLAEELVWRGFAFRRLRQGRSFWSAVWWTMPLLAATHVPIVLTAGPAIGLGAMVVAAVTTLAFSYLYETGRQTLWAAALLHTAIDSFKLFVIPEGAVPTLSLLLIIASILIPLLVLLVPRRMLAPTDVRGGEQS